MKYMSNNFVQNGGLDSGLRPHHRWSTYVICSRRVESFGVQYCTTPLFRSAFLHRFACNLHGDFLCQKRNAYKVVTVRGQDIYDLRASEKEGRDEVDVEGRNGLSVDGAKDKRWRNAKKTDTDINQAMYEYCRVITARVCMGSKAADHNRGA